MIELIRRTEKDTKEESEKKAREKARAERRDRAPAGKRMTLVVDDDDDVEDADDTHVID